MLKEWQLQYLINQKQKFFIYNNHLHYNKHNKYVKIIDFMIIYKRDFLIIRKSDKNKSKNKENKK